MNLLILGGGNCQLNAIKRARAMGHRVIVSDYYPDAPGKKYCDQGELVSTFDFPANLQVGEKHKIDGIITVGTDQPVLTVSQVAAGLKLPSLIDINTAKAVTNKQVMKDKFTANQIPTVNFRFLGRDFTEQELAGLKFPAVIKPLDSQGQRGVYRVTSIEEIRGYFAEVLGFSREEIILAEEYYESDEITVSGWVVEGELHLLTVTDRVTYERERHIGICTAHQFPSRHLATYFEEIKDISEQIVAAFQIENGPIYFQMLVGAAGIKVNEIACRIGGAYEDIFIPHLTGVDILKLVIDAALGKELDLTALNNYDLLDNNRHLSVQLFFARPGKVKELSNPELLKELPGVIEAGFNFKVGDEIGMIENATQRAGFMLIEGQSKVNLLQNLRKAYGQLKIVDSRGGNLVMVPEGLSLLDD